MNITSTLPNYELHVPDHFRHFLIVGAASGILGVGLIIARVEIQWLAYILLAVALLVALAAFALQQIITLRGRLHTRNLMIQARQWRGDEQVLDVGCGNGIMTMAVAHQLKSGKVTGIDIWDSTAGRQTAEIFWRNAQAEGVRDRVEVRETDARQMPFADSSFDVVVSSLALHHMGGVAESVKTIQEMTRVLKPGGTILLYDLFPFSNAATTIFQQRGFKVEHLKGLAIRTLKAEKG
ncbi:MAG: class I SAM-dependent methyltransferase [Chloroflexota bacterium]